MAETYTLESARVVYGNMLLLVFDASSARSGVPDNDPSKFSISSSGTSVGVKTPNSVWSYRGTIGQNSSHWKPSYTQSTPGDDKLVQYVELDRTVQQSEDGDITVTLTAGYISDDTNTSAAASSFAVQVWTYRDSSGDLGPGGFPLRDGSDETEVTAASAGTRLLHIKASDASSVGNGNAITSSFTATVGGSISPNNSPIYRSGQSVNGSSASLECIEMLNGDRLDTSVSLNSGGSTPASFTMFFAGWFDTDANDVLLYLQTRTPDIETAASLTARRSDWRVYDGAALKDLGDAVYNERNEHGRFLVCCLEYNYGTTTASLYSSNGELIGSNTQAYTGEDWSGVFWVRQSGATGSVKITELIIYDGVLSESNRKGLCATLANDHGEQALTYYVDPTSGSDSNDGLSSSTPWQTFDWDNRRALLFNSGDHILIKAGEEVADNSRIVMDPQWGASFGRGYKHPALISYYGSRSDGRPKFPATSSGFGTAGHDLTEHPNVALVGLDFDNQFRNPRHTNYGGFSNIGHSSNAEFAALEANAEGSSNQPNDWGDGFPTIVMDCEIGFFGSGTEDDAGTPDGETLYIFEGNYVHDIYSASSSGERDHIPTGMYLDGHSLPIVAGNVYYRCGWNPDVASIGDWSSGSKTWETGVTAVYDETNDRTSLSKASAFSDFVWYDTQTANNFIAGPLYVTVKGADNTEYDEQIIEDKVSDNQIYITGNPLGLADAGTETVELHGGTPAAENGLSRAQYFDKTPSAGLLNIHNIFIDGADLEQQRGGGYKVENIAVNNSGAGYLKSIADMCSLRGNYWEGGKRNRGKWWPAVRSWGYEIGGYSDNDDSGDPYYAEAIENICNGAYNRLAQTDYPTADAQTHGLKMSWISTAGEMQVLNNTIVRGAGNLLDFGAVAHSANTEVRRNLVVQSESGADAVTDTDLVDGSYGSATISHNIYYHPDGSSGLHFEDNASAFSTWQTNASTTSEQFADPDFTKENADLAEYYGTLSGGSDDYDAWVSAVIAANQAGDMGELAAETTLHWLARQFGGQDLVLSDGGGTYMPGASIPLVDTAITVGSDGTTCDIVATLIGNGNIWTVPRTGTGRTLTLTGSTSGTITATIPDADAGVVVSTVTTIADTATFTATLNKTVVSGETLTVLKCDIGIIDDSSSIDWKSEDLPTGTAVTNNSTAGGSGTTVSRVPVVLNIMRRRSRLRRR